MDSLKKFEKINGGKEKYLVLEVGNYNTKLIEVVPTLERLTVQKGFIIATPEGTLEENVIVKSDELVKLLGEKIKEEKITSKNVTVSLSSGDIITREMAVPKMNKSDTISFIKINSRDLFPVDLDEYTLGYVSMGGEDNSKLMIIAIPNDIITPYLEITEQLGLALSSINFSGFELYNLIDFELGSDAGTYAVIDLGSKNTNFIIVSNGMLMYNRVLKVGSDDVTKEIAENFKCTLTKAEKIKRDYNSVIMEGSLKETDDVYVVAEIFRDVLSTLLTDVANIIEYYNGKHSRFPVSKVYIIGLATKISGICEFVEETLGIETDKIREFERVIFEETAKAPKRRQVTLENCLGAVPIDDKKVKLIKGKLKLSRVYYNISPFMYQVGALVCVLVVLALCILNFGNTKIKEKIGDFDSYIASKKELIDLQSKYSESLENVNAIKKLIEELPAGKEEAYIPLGYIQECANFVDGISIKDCTINSDTQIQINFSTTSTNSANLFDERLRDYFDFERTFYNSSRSDFRLDLTLKSNL